MLGARTGRQSLLCMAVPGCVGPSVPPLGVDALGEAR